MELVVEEVEYLIQELHMVAKEDQTPVVLVL